jgi:ferric-chelate reductase
MDPDRATRTQRTNTYTTQVWYFLACFIFLVAALRLASVLHSKYSRGRRSSRADPETISSTPSSALQLRRFPLAVINTYRILALRCTVRVNIGTFYTLNIAEVCLTLAYIVALFTWTFINSTFYSAMVYVRVLITAHDYGLHSDQPGRGEAGPYILV